MILTSLRLQNFGAYRGESRANLSPVAPEKPIVLFGGMNGGGKTTLLDAIQLALYGPKAKCSGRGRLGYRDYLRAMINRDANPSEGAAVEISFRRFEEGEMKYYRINRSWQDTPKGLIDRIEVFDDTKLDPELSEHWDEFIESYIPSGIAHLFFFDAEQIKDLADGEHAAEILGTAIHSLLGLDLVDRLETDLIVLERRKRSESRSNEEQERIRQAEEEMRRHEAVLEEAQAEQAALNTEADRFLREVEKVEKRFRDEGGELFQNRAGLEAERARLKSQLDEQQAVLCELAEGIAPLLLAPTLLEQTEVMVRAETHARRNEVLANALEERDRDVIQRLRDKNMPDRHISIVAELLAEDRASRKQSGSGQALPHAGEHVYAEIRHLRVSVLSSVRDKALQTLDAMASLQERLTRIEMELARVPAADAIAGLQDELVQARKRLEERKAQQAAQEDKLRYLRRQLEDSQHRLKRELGDSVDLELDREHVSRVLKHSAKVRDTLGHFRVAVMRKHAERLERLILESFSHLLRKHNLVSGLKIDPATFRIELTGGDGKPLPFERLSAGERQLLATSILWGLAKASGRPLPTIIDTPLGRLDSSHRKNLIERYFPVASHQVILLSTDEEIDEGALGRLSRHIGQSYELRFDSQCRSTKIIQGYFWKHETSS